ncbi:hypothetical protein ACHAWO_013851 [Cyclotella atomus]|uniref:Ribosomal protein L9 domain-containing protein n=1 Tax=Cyclotella atomus TaxID=382360 RepID=A0ABD3MTY4_9STRA
MPATVMLQRLALVLAITAQLQHETSASRSPSYPSTTYAKASFIPPAAPSSVGWPSAANPQRVMHRIATGYGTYTDTIALRARPKKAGGASASSSTSSSNSTKTKPVSKNGKIQVVLLKSDPDLGQTGDVIFVSSAIFQNTLKRNGKARLISEEEVAKLEREKMEAEEEMKAKALDAKRLIEESGGSCNTIPEGDRGVALAIVRKAGPEGNLFARVNPKIIMDELKDKFASLESDVWDAKGVKLLGVKEFEGGDEVKKMDVKTVGKYIVDLTLGKGVDVTFVMEILAE